MKRITQLVASFALLLGLGASVLVLTPQPSYAACTDAKSCVNEGVNQVDSGTDSNDLNDFLTNIINLLLFAVGAVSVIMIIVGGFRYTLSGGDQSQVTAAKNTVMYSVIGLVVAALSFAIVNFVVGRL